MHEKKKYKTTKITKRQDGKKVNLFYIVDQNHQVSVVVVDHSRKFKGIWLVNGGYNRGIFIQGRGEIIVPNLKKEN